MAETLDQVKRAFGRDAVILNTRTVSRGRVLGRAGRALVEITAAKNMSDLPDALRVGRLPRALGRYEGTDGAVAMVPPSSNVAVPRTSTALASEVGALKSLVRELVNETRHARLNHLPEELYEAYRGLTENSIAEHTAQRLVQQVRDRLGEDELRDPKAVRDCLASAIESMLPVAGPIQAARSGAPTIIALVGPTGVGKTTTIAKLAANLSLRENRSVGLITIDTYRIAAVEQLRTYARIIDVPLTVVSSPDQLQQAVEHMADRDFIFIDTAGRSQRDTAKIHDLAEFFHAVRPDEVHLVLSSTCDERVLRAATEAFADVGINRLILTKLDEAIGFGVVLSCLEKTEARLSYVTTGQDVPDDIHVGESASLAQLILGQRSIPTPSGAS